MIANAAEVKRSKFFSNSRRGIPSLATMLPLSALAFLGTHKLDEFIKIEAIQLNYHG
jgi:hypothetical protein